MMMNARHNHPSSSPAAAGGASDAAAALKGANLAFNKSKPKPVPPPKPTPARPRETSLIAASAASAHDRSKSASPVQRQHTGTSLAATTPGDRDRFGRDGTADMRDRLSNFLSSSPAATASPSHMTPHTKLDPKSPSYIAATLAASRSASPSPQPHASPASLTPAQLNQLHQMQNARLSAGKVNRRGSGGSSSLVSSLDLPDTSSTPATGHLITMFERRPEDVDPVKRNGGDSARPRVRPLTPERELSPSRAKAARMGVVEEVEEVEESDTQRPMVSKPKPKPKLRPVTPVMIDGQESVEEVTPQAKKPVPKPAKLLLSPARISDKRSNSEQLLPVRETQFTMAASPMYLEAPEVQSMSQLTRIPITQTARPESKPQPPATPEPRRSRPKAQQATPSSPPVIKRADTEVISPKPTRPASKAKLRPPTPPQSRGTGGKSREAFTSPLNEPRSMASVYDHGRLQEPFRRSETEARPSTADTSSSNDTFVSAESGQTAVPDQALAVPSPRPIYSAQSTPRRSSANSSPSHMTPRRTPASSNSNLPLHSLSNAIMAGSLAAARLTPSNSGNSAQQQQQQQQRTRSPRLRQTLRRPPSKSDDEDEMRKRKHQRASNKHSHHEGARRRWRDEITPRERRRYEALWASNRGRLLLESLPPGGSSPQRPAAPADAGDCVLNVVARELWRRSRLPAEELAEVWDLVDRGRRGMLGKAEFVVGMWLIDQRLRGRKIPNKVSSSVWDSATGVTVPPPKGKK